MLEYFREHEILELLRLVLNFVQNKIPCNLNYIKVKLKLIKIIINKQMIFLIKYFSVAYLKAY